MKKILFLIGLSILTFGAFAEKVPTVIVNKSQGGFTAIFNLYNYVSYTPADVSANGIGHLDCSGSGFSACRIPPMRRSKSWDIIRLSKKKRPAFFRKETAFFSLKRK